MKESKTDPSIYDGDYLLASLCKAAVACQDAGISAEELAMGNFSADSLPPELHEVSDFISQHYAKRPMRLTSRAGTSVNVIDTDNEHEGKLVMKKIIGKVALRSASFPFDRLRIKPRWLMRLFWTDTKWYEARVLNEDGAPIVDIEMLD